jgi:hypothetical protein
MSIGSVTKQHSKDRVDSARELVVSFHPIIKPIVPYLLALKREKKMHRSDNQAMIIPIFVSPLVLQVTY